LRELVCFNRTYTTRLLYISIEKTRRQNITKAQDSCLLPKQFMMCTYGLMDI
jgi:hypothetical protein